MQYTGRPHGGEGRGPSDEDGLWAGSTLEWGVHSSVVCDSTLEQGVYSSVYSLETF